MKTTKRILVVTIKRMVDDDPDTSYLGEYSNSPTSEFSIDRMHSEDCASVVPVNQDGVQKLRNARAYIVNLQNAIDAESEEWEEWADLEDAYGILDSLADDTPECDCGERGDMRRNEYRYFNPSFNYVTKQGKPANGLTLDDVRSYTRHDYERMESLNNQNWCYIGIRAEAEVCLSVKQDNLDDNITWAYPKQTVTSGGLWGIESDSDKSYLAEVQAEELSGLKSELLALGFSRRAISQAFKSVQDVDA